MAAKASPNGCCGRSPSLVSELGLSSDEAKALATALENEAKGLDRELADKLKPITITQSGTAGECQIQYSATLDLKNNRYHVNFDKYCGERGPDVPTATVTTVSVNPGDAAALTAQAVNYLGTAYPLTGATVTGLAAVMADGSAEPAAVIVGGTATFNFTAAKPRKDGDYPVTVNLTTFDGKTARLGRQSHREQRGANGELRGPVRGQSRSRRDDVDPKRHRHRDRRQRGQEQSRRSQSSRPEARTPPRRPRDEPEQRVR